MKEGLVKLNYPLFVDDDVTADKILFLQSSGKSHMAIIVESDIQKLNDELKLAAKCIFEGDSDTKTQIDNKPID
jgi:hypothetical protein